MLLHGGGSDSISTSHAQYPELSRGYSKGYVSSNTWVALDKIPRLLSRRTAQTYAGCIVVTTQFVESNNRGETDIKATLHTEFGPPDELQLKEMEKPTFG